MAAATSIASAAGLAVDGAVVLNDSNRLVVRLTPCDVVARVASTQHPFSSEREVQVVRRLARTDAPVGPLAAGLEPRVFEVDGFRVSLWTWLEPRVPMRPLSPPAEYGRALERLHAGLREIEVATPHVRDRVAEVARDLTDLDVTPDLPDADRELLLDAVHRLTGSILDRGLPDQLLHGEPHPGNVLDTEDGLRFVDFENAAHGPVEYDLAWVPKDVRAHYPPIDEALLDDCRGLVLTIIAAYRWRRDDEHPSGRDGGVAFLDAVRRGPPWPESTDITW